MVLCHVSLLNFYHFQTSSILKFLSISLSIVSLSLLHLSTFSSDPAAPACSLPFRWIVHSEAEIQGYQRGAGPCPQWYEHLVKCMKSASFLILPSLLPCLDFSFCFFPVYFLSSFCQYEASINIFVIYLAWFHSFCLLFLFSFSINRAKSYIGCNQIEWKCYTLLCFKSQHFISANLTSAKDENLEMHQVLDQTLQELGSLWKYQEEWKKGKNQWPMVI